MVALLTALQDLKRQHPAHYGGDSIATTLFRRAWVRLLDGEAAGEVADVTVAEAVAQILFPGCDAGFWPEMDVGRAEATRLMRASVAESAGGALADEQVRILNAAVERLVGEYYAAPVRLAPRASAPPAGAPGAPAGGASQTGAPASGASRTGALPPSLELLCRQPRAGATRPGYQRLVLVPAELHGEHCLLTAVYAWLYAAEYGADAGVSFLAGLAHHLHNALLPDCGFAGEVLLGEHLQSIIDGGRARALAELPAELAQRTRAALQHHETIAAPEGRAISAGDVLDRVLDVKWRTRAAAVVDADILGDLDLVHEGPLKAFQTDLLAKTGLWRGE